MHTGSENKEMTGVKAEHSLPANTVERNESWEIWKADGRCLKSQSWTRGK